MKRQLRILATGMTLFLFACAKPEATPQSQTFSATPPKSLVGRMAAKLKDSGSSIYTNTVGHQEVYEKLLKSEGSEQLKTDLKEAIAEMIEVGGLADSRNSSPDDANATELSLEPFQVKKPVQAHCLIEGGGGNGGGAQCNGGGGGICVAAAAFASAKFCAKAYGYGFGYAKASAQCRSGERISVEAYAYAYAHAEACAEAFAYAFAYACAWANNGNPAANPGGKGGDGKGILAAVGLVEETACPVAEDGPLGGWLNLKPEQLMTQAQ